MDNKHNSVNRIMDVDWVQYKLCKIIDKTATDIHHIIWKKYRNQYNTNVEENKTRISRRLHVALNWFFGDKQNPRDQLKQIFEIVKPVLSTWVRNELYTLLTLPDDMFYNENLINGKHKKKLWAEWK